MSSDALCRTYREPFADPRRGYRWTVRLGRPARANALDGPLLAALNDALRGAEARNAALVVLEGEGPVFSAGLDLHWLERLRGGNGNERAAAGEALARVLDGVAALDAPVLAYVGKGAFGAGLALAAAADCVVAAPDARFRLSEARLGISGGILLKTLRPRIPEPALRRWVLTARLFDADEAAASGWLAALVSETEWPAYRARFEASVAEGAPSVLAAFKRALREPVPVTTDGRLLAEALENPDGEEGLRAFRERRAPRWTGLP
jgi:methylglutaconyl-CoA hydratase